jgi:hypothetical protein
LGGFGFVSKAVVEVEEQLTEFVHCPSLHSRETVQVVV